MYPSVQSDFFDGLNLVIFLAFAAIITTAAFLSILFSLFSIACMTMDCLATILRTVHRKITPAILFIAARTINRTVSTINRL